MENWPRERWRAVKRSVISEVRERRDNKQVVRLARRCKLQKESCRDEVSQQNTMTKNLYVGRPDSHGAPRQTQCGKLAWMRRGLDGTPRRKKPNSQGGPTIHGKRRGVDDGVAVGWLTFLGLSLVTVSRGRVSTVEAYLEA